MSESSRSGSHSREQLLQMIASGLDGVRAQVDTVGRETREGLLQLRDRIEEQGRDTRKYVDVRLKEHDDASRERLGTEVRTLKESISHKDRELEELKKEIEDLKKLSTDLDKWRESVKGKAAAVVGLVTLGGSLAGVGGALLSKIFGS